MTIVRPRLRRGFTLVAVLAAAACASIAGLDEYQGTGGGLGGDAGPGGGDSACRVTEDCTNGVDDDCNGLVDCADPACKASGHACVEVPLGWSGPVRLPAPGVLDESACAPPFPVQAWEVFASLADAGPLDCQCSCLAPSDGGACAPRLDLFGSACDAACSTPSISLELDACVAIPAANCGISRAASLRAPALSGGCAPRLVETRPPLGSGVVRACAAPPGARGCGLGSCTPPWNVDRELCVYKEGTSACPGGWDRQVVRSGYGDRRTCTACTCSAPTDYECNGQVDRFQLADCLNARAGAISLRSCIEINPSSTNSVRLVSMASPNGGSCGASTSQSQGGPVAVNPTTFCCRTKL